MTSQPKHGLRPIAALRFKQWLSEWDAYDFDEHAYRRKPSEHLFVFSLAAADLRRLCAVYKRERVGSEAEGIQRLRDPSRTGRIRSYVKFGYPYGDLKPPQQTLETFPLKKPGWLPTSIVINILVDGDERHGKKILKEHVAKIEIKGDGPSTILVPDEFDENEQNLAPFEVIDGQHRLWAFDPNANDLVIPDDFELPVVAYHGLDIAWQAYLFWSINVSPKRINPSHAFDLYPLLRTQDWLDRVGELTVYREARAQELTELFYAHPESPWRDRINMLGERGHGVSQAAWVRALLASFFSTGRGQSRPGLFQSHIDGLDEPLEWKRPQQAAFIICCWRSVVDALENRHSLSWIRAYKGEAYRAFTDKTSWLNQDQGVRAILNTINDIFFASAFHWCLHSWIMFSEASDNDASLDEVSIALEQIEHAEFKEYIVELADGLAFFDWRSLEAPGVKGNEEIEVRKRSYRGSGGYSALRMDVLKTLAEVDNSVGRVAADLLIIGV